MFVTSTAQLRLVAERESDLILSEGELVAHALALGARAIDGWSPDETHLAESARELALSPGLAASLEAAIAAGRDPLGEAFARLRSPAERRPLGATYTPAPIVHAMIEWAAGEEPGPARVVDPGAGSGRFSVAAGRRFPSAQLVAVEVDPVAAIIARGHLAAAGLGDRASVLLRDFRAVDLPPMPGRTLYLGNPPYVRHHQIPAAWKEWLVRSARSLGQPASQLAGLHAHFFVATALKARPGDFGIFITSAEWLDVNYGSLVRSLLLDGLGAESVQVLEPTAQPFADAATTAAITCFQVARKPRTVRLRRVAAVDELDDLSGGTPYAAERLRASARWSELTRPRRNVPADYVELGELCRVHRGAVTGANALWIVAPDWSRLPPEVLQPAVTRARELFSAGDELRTTAHLRRVVDLPADLERLPAEALETISFFLDAIEKRGGAAGYVARHRKAWWSVGLREPAPILATYMARRPPVFVRNLAGARHINIAHGLYPREELSAEALDRLAAFLRRSVTQSEGRTYAGGLTKFEPREMERLLVPRPEALLAA